MFQLRPYQADAVNKIRGAYKRGIKSPLLVLPTGGGKTIVFSHIAANAAARGKRVLILVHRIELLRQTSSALLKSGVKHGLINPRYTPNIIENVQVASVQTLVKRMNVYKEFDLIICDEAHHCVAGNTWGKIMEAYPSAYKLGVTATPVRGDGTGLNNMFDELVQGPQINELISMGFLAKPIVYAPKNKIDLTGIRIKLGDYDKEQLAERLDKPHITGDAVAHYIKYCHGTPAVAFCVSIEHAKHVAEQFRQSGVRAQFVDGKMEDEERRKLLVGLAKNEVDIITSCDLISEGTDIPAIGCAILLRPTKSLGLFLQQVGRALRVVDGKQHAIILDHVGNCLVHGMPEEDREWLLEGIKKNKRRKNGDEPDVKVRQCKACYAVHRILPVCPQCGYVYSVDAREVKTVDGELALIQADQAEALRLDRKKEVAMADSYEALKAIAKARGYHAGWAKHVYNEKLRKGRIKNLS